MVSARSVLLTVRRHSQATIDIHPFDHAPPPSEEPRSRLQRLCRALGIGLFYQLIYQKFHPSKKIAEPKKIAIREDRWMAIFAGSIHLIPIAATAIICGLNLSGYYIGGELAGFSNEDDAKFIGLQFAAKLHELTINASLTAIIFSFVRYQLAVAGGLPFGALFTGLQFQEISFLWSMELWGAARAQFMRLRIRLAIILLVVVCAFLSVSAGSSSATLMRPRLDYWPAGGTDFWVKMPQAEFLSTNVTSSQVPNSCLVDNGDPSCPYADWQTIAQSYLSYYLGQSTNGYFPLGFYIQGAKAVRFLTAQPRVDSSGDLRRLCVATVPSSSVGDALIELAYLYRSAAYFLREGGKWRFWSWQELQQSVAAHQPIVHARCLQIDASTYGSYTPSLYHNDNGSIPFYSLADLKYYNMTGDFPTINVPITDSFQTLLQKANTSSVPQVAWATVPQQSIDDTNNPQAGPSSDPTLGAVLSIPANDDYGAVIYVCTIDSRIAPASVTTLAQAVVGGEPDGWWNLATYGANNTYPRIFVDHEWAKYLNPVARSDNSTAFQNMLKIANLWGSDQADDYKDAQHKVESLLATVIANGLARRDYGRELAGSLLGEPNGLSDNEAILVEWAEQMMPSHGRPMGPGGNAFNITPSDQQNSTKFTMHTTANGYAYSSQGSAAQFAMFVLFLHALLAVSHWIYMSWSKHSSSSWDSIAELVALAMNSRRSEVFENTGAGIDSADLFKNQTRVVEREGHLELLVGDAPARGAPIKANDVYG